MMEVIFIVLMLGGFMIPSMIFSMWWIFWVFLTFGIIFGSAEGICKAVTGMTVSQQFWHFSIINPHGAWIIIAGMFIAWMSLLVHLSSKLIGR